MESHAERSSRGHSGRLAVFAGIAVGIALLAAAAVGWAHLRNELVVLDVAAQTQWKQVENVLQRQHDLIPNLVEVTRGYAKHEREVLTQVADSRSRLLSAPAKERVEAAVAMDTALARLLAVGEAYPDLKADRRFRDLQFELAGAQNRIAVERKRYNELVGSFNARLRMLPWSLVASGFSEREYYSPPAESLAQPNVEI